MIRQAHTYLVSAMSGATLIAIAIVAFVLLVSAQVFRDWPIAALGGNDTAHISDSRAASAPDAAAKTAAAAASPGESAAQNSAGRGSGNGSGAQQAQVAEGGQAPSAGPTATTSPVDSGEARSGGNQGSDAPSSATTQDPSSSGSSSSGGKSGSGTASTPTGKVTETVNNTVSGVDETVTGGALGKTGVTEATEGVVNEAAGPESPVGKAVDETVEAVTGLLGGNR